MLRKFINFIDSAVITKKKVTTAANPESPSTTNMPNINAYRPLIQHQIATETLTYKPTVVLVGATGDGKTTLANKLCNTSHTAGAGRGSVTQNLFRNDVSIGMNAFSLIDTPGTDSSTGTYKHAVLLREALTATGINTIFVVIKFENRFEKMIKTFYTQPVHLFASKVVVMISHWDLSKNVDSDFKTISDMFAEDCPDVSNVIFYSEKCLDGVVADYMFQCMSQMKCEKLQITDDDFHLNFNTVEATMQMQRSFSQYTRKAKERAEAFSSYIINDLDKSSDDKDEILHMMLVQFKNDLDEMCDNFVNEHGDSMTEMNYFTFLIKIQAENVKLCDTFSELVIPLMSYNLFDNEDPRNLIKQCPNCKLIWYKTEGCDGETKCGNRQFATTSASLVKALYKYVVNWVDGKVKVQKNPVQYNPAPPTPANTTSPTAVGCGYPMVWKNLPKLDDKLIFTLYSVTTMEQVKTIIRNERFRDARVNYERNIDTDFRK